MANYIKQLTRESFVYGLSGIISKFMFIFFVPIYTRIFTPEDYGVMSLINITMAVISIFVVLALDNSAHRWYWENEDIEDRKITISSWAWCQVCVSLVSAGFIIAFSNSLGQLLIGRNDAETYFRLVAITLPLNVLGIVAINWLRMQRRPWATITLTLSTTLFNILITLLLVVILRWGLVGVFTAQVVTAAIGTLIALCLLRKWIDPRKFQWKRLKSMLNYSFPLIMASLAYWMVNLSGFYFVQYFSSTSEVGLYQVGSTIASVMALATGAFQQAWGPFAMSIHKKTEAKQVYANVLQIYIWVACFLSATLTLFSPELLSHFTTEEYAGASRIIGILAFSHVMIGLSYIAAVGPAIVKTNIPYGLALAVAAGVTIGLNYFLVPHFGKEGSAFSTFIAQAFVPLYVFYCSQKLYPIPYRFKNVLVAVTLSLTLVFIGNIWQIDNIILGIAIKIFLLSLFFSAFIIIKMKNSEDRIGVR